MLCPLMHVGQHAMKILTSRASLLSTPSVHTVGFETAYEYKQGDGTNGVGSKA